jgi:hypothetical protein
MAWFHFESIAWFNTAAIYDFEYMRQPGPSDPESPMALFHIEQMRVAGQTTCFRKGHPGGCLMDVNRNRVFMLSGLNAKCDGSKAAQIVEHRTVDLFLDPQNERHPQSLGEFPILERIPKRQKRRAGRGCTVEIEYIGFCLSVSQSGHQHVQQFCLLPVFGRRWIVQRACHATDAPTPIQIPLNKSDALFQRGDVTCHGYELAPELWLSLVKFRDDALQCCDTRRLVAVEPCNDKDKWTGSMASESPQDALEFRRCRLINKGALL